MRSCSGANYGTFDDHAVVMIASATSAAVMLTLVDEGKLSLDERRDLHSAFTGERTWWNPLTATIRVRIPLGTPKAP